MNPTYNEELVSQMTELGEPGNRQLNDALYPSVAGGDPLAREEMIESNMPLVINKVDSYIGCFPHLAYLRDDLISEGFVGLVTAVDKMRENGPVEEPNPTGYMSHAIQRAIGTVVDQESAVAASQRTQRRARQDGSAALPQQLNGLDDLPDLTVDLAGMVELRDLLEACCRTDKERTIVRMREQGHVDKDIAAAIGIPLSSTYRMRRELYDRFLKKSEMESSS